MCWAHPCNRLWSTDREAVNSFIGVPTGSPSHGEVVTVYVYDINQPSLPTSFLFCSCVYFCLYGPFSCISFHKFSRHLYIFWLCPSSLISAVLVLSTIYLFTKVSFNPDIIPSGWLGSKHQLTINELTKRRLGCGLFLSVFLWSLMFSHCVSR